MVYNEKILFYHVRRILLSKVIELSKHRKIKSSSRCNRSMTNEPPWFYELNEGIGKLVHKNLDHIVSNIHDNINIPCKYILKDNTHGDNSYFMDSDITDHVNLIDPFSIHHKLQFNRGIQLSIISENDWLNITDIIIRMAMIIHYDLWDGPLEPFHFSHQYRWTSIKVDRYNEL